MGEFHKWKFHGLKNKTTNVANQLKTFRVLRAFTAAFVSI
jgi:hypothetical protein